MAKDQGLIYCATLSISLLCLPLTAQASFIESTIGTAVVNDATATYFNPAALTLLKNPQWIGLGSIAEAHTRFVGQATQTITGFTQFGESRSQTNYYLPSFYLAAPVKEQLTIGLAVVANDFNRSIEENAILRYDQAGNHINSFDVVPGFSLKLNEFFSVGAAVNFSYADFLLQPVVGFPGLNIPDAQSRNECSDNSLGWDVGILVKPTKTTTLGANYRSAIRYRFKGKSILDSNPVLISDHYQFDFWTPARAVFSMNQALTPSMGFIATLQYIQWDILKELAVRGIATQVGAQALIVDGSVPYYLHNSWIVTAGSHYRITPKWIGRVAATYSQAGGNPNVQIVNGNSLILGASTSYELTKNFVLDGSYSHAFIQAQPIDIASNKHVIKGVNTASRNAVSVKLTINFS